MVRGVVTISGTPTVAGAALTYTVTLTGGAESNHHRNNSSNNDQHAILEFRVGTNAQTVCVNAAITPITYATTGATGANVTICLQE